MQVEISIAVPPDLNLVQFRMNYRQLSALTEMFMDFLENNREKYEQIKANMYDSSTETCFHERLDHTLTEKQAKVFRELLKKNHIQEREICEKYRIDQIDELTVGDVLDITVKNVLPQMKREQEQLSKP